MLIGLNHITLAVADLDVSFQFYTETLSFKPHVKWRHGAYLSVGELWFCLSLDKTITVREDYTHIAFSVDEHSFCHLKNRLMANNVTIWKDNKSEGDSIYFLDPDKHKLEAHLGNLESRLASLKKQPYDDLEWF